MKTTFGTYIAPTRPIPLNEHDGPPWVHVLGPTRGPAFTIRETLPPFVTVSWTRAAGAVAADVRAREKRLAYLMAGVGRQRMLELEWD